MKRPRGSRLDLVQLECRDVPATFTVTNTIWGNVNTVGSLPWAVDRANSTAGKDTITFATNVGQLGANPVFNSTSTLTVNDDVSIIGETVAGNGKSVTIGGVKPFQFTNRPFHIPEAPPPDTVSSITGIKFVGCTGGAIEVTGGSLSVSVSEFKQNTNAVGGGGAIINGTNGTVTIGGAVYFTQNTANYGGAILNQGKLQLDGGSFVQNEAEPNAAFVFVNPLGAAILGGRGGALYSTGLVTTSGGVAFTNNRAESAGGGVYIASDSKEYSVFTAAVFTENVVNKLNGGVYVPNGDGGGMRVESGLVKIDGDSQFVQNSAGHGGGLSVNKGTVDIRKTTFELNFTPFVNGQYWGRAIDITAGATVGINSSTFVNNGIRGAYTDNGGNTFDALSPSE